MRLSGAAADEELFSQGLFRDYCHPGLIMPKATDIKILGAKCDFEKVPYRTPIKFGGRVGTDTQLMNVTVEVATRSGRHEAGFGSMPTGNIWAWPSDLLTPEQTAQAMSEFAVQVIDLASDYPDYAHPLDMVGQFEVEFDHLAAQVQKRLKLPEAIPTLAQRVAASALDAALHDAYGRANGQNSYQVLSSKYMNHDLSEYLDSSFKGEYLDRYVLAQPQPRMPLYHLVGALDPLTPADVATPVKDGVPECLAAWIAKEGITHFKIKLAGDDLAFDLHRVAAVDATASEALAARGGTTWRYSLDFNEKCPNVAYVVEFLKKIQASRPACFDRIHYLEQPTHRDLKAHPENVMHQAAEIKPVVIDESLLDYDSLLLAREQGYSGIALKTCKGHSHALLMAAAGQKLGVFLCVQDLTCPGYSFLHSASLASRIPGVAAVEGNARQYCPSANRRWRADHPTIFEIKDGTIETGTLIGEGLGF